MRSLIIIALCIFGYSLWNNKEARVASYLGYLLNCDAKIDHLTFKAWNQLSLHDVTLAPKKSHEPAFEAERIDMVLTWKQCWKRPLPIQELSITQPRLFVRVASASEGSNYGCNLLHHSLPSSTQLIIDHAYIGSSEIQVLQTGHKNVCFTMKPMTLHHIEGTAGEAAQAVFLSMLGTLSEQPPLHHLIDTLPLPQEQPPKPANTPRIPQQIEHIRRHVHHVF